MRVGGWRQWPSRAPDRWRRLAVQPIEQRVGEVDIARGQLATLDEARLRDVPFADDPVKGAGVSLAVTRWSLGVGGTYQSIFDAPSRESLGFCT